MGTCSVRVLLVEVALRALMGRGAEDNWVASLSPPAQQPGSIPLRCAQRVSCARTDADARAPPTMMQQGWTATGSMLRSHVSRTASRWGRAFIIGLTWCRSCVIIPLGQHADQEEGRTGPDSAALCVQADYKAEQRICIVAISRCAPVQQLRLDLLECLRS
jgi:hypothetical protein